MKDDKEVERFLIKEYFYIHKIGLAYVPWDKESAIISIFQYAIYLIVLSISTALLGYTAFLTIDDIALFSQDLHITLICVVAIINIINNSMIYRNDMVEIHKNLMNGLCNYETGEFYEGEKKNIFKQKKFLLLFWPLYYGFCASMAIVIGPLMDSYYGVDAVHTSYPQVYLKLPFAMWTPFDMGSQVPLHLILSVFQAFMVIINNLTISAGVAMYVVVLNYLCLHLNLLTNSIDNLDVRATELYKVRQGNRASSKLDRVLYNKCYNDCLIENIKHHQSILRLHKMYVNLSSVPLFVPFIAGAVLMSMAVVHFMSDDVRIGPKLTSGTVVFGEMLNMLMLCVYGEKLKLLSEGARDTIYSIRWYEMDKECHQTVSIFQQATLKPMNVKCVYLLDINMETFATLLCPSTTVHIIIIDVH
ncbi:uncharacterized protein isoform X2 [Rhodnius prolixus]|uniref:uncharacterized protein isoform X2 n=1 Tax=Rhodnius prolixus TaxID=13249 RepID=UPI003D187ED4